MKFQDNVVDENIAIVLGSLGFCDDTFLGYSYSYHSVRNKLGSNQRGEAICCWDKFDRDTRAPLWQEAIDFFRNKYDFNIIVSYAGKADDGTKYYYHYIEDCENKGYVYNPTDLYLELLNKWYVDKGRDSLFDELSDKRGYEHMFELGFAFKSYEEARKNAILTAIELVQKQANADI